MHEGVASHARSTHQVALVGTGMVSASFAYSLMQRQRGRRSGVLDADRARAEGETMDLDHGLAFVRSMKKDKSVALPN